jgi:rSAM/selenodomain-associated transferase 1
MTRYAVGVMARAPSSPGKTRLAAHLPPDRLRSLRVALAADTLATVCALPGADPVVFATPDGAEDEIRALAPRPVRVVPQSGASLGDRMRNALAQLLDGDGYEAAMLIGTDLPLLTEDHFAEAEALLRSRGGVVIGPADDGGYYLIGMTRVCPSLFEAIAWGSDTVLFETLEAAARAHVDACLIRGGYDVDTIEDLRRVAADLEHEPSALARRLRRWLAEGGESQLV